MFVKEDGKKALHFIPKRADQSITSLKENYGESNVFNLPCGQCESCRRNYAEQWGIRCTLEAEMHSYNYFVTLTYDENHIQYANKKDLRKFIDRMEFHVQKKFPYFACLERGEETGRYHWHIILFLDKELTLYDPTKLNGYYYYHAKELYRTWNFGLHNLAPFVSTCARYVAKYTTKNGRIFMSRNIGKSYFLANYKKIIKDDFKVYGDFDGRYSADIPKAFARWFLLDPPPGFEAWKLKKQDLGRLYTFAEMRSIVTTYEDNVVLNRQSRIKERRLHQ